MRKFLNAYRPSQAKTSSIEPSELLKELSANESALDWVNSLILFHKKISEQKEVTDFILKATCKALFPTNLDLAFPQILLQISSFIKASSLVDSYSKQVLCAMIDSFDQESLQGTDYKIVWLSDFFGQLSFVDLPALSKECSQQSIILHNNITVSDIEEPILAQLNEPHTFRHTECSTGALSPKHESPVARKKKLINEPQQMETHLRQEIFEQAH